MSGQVASRVAWLLARLALMLVTLGLVLGAANGPLPGPDDESWTLIPLAAGLPVIGALVATHQPRNVIAWIFLGVGFASGLAVFTYNYGLYALVTNRGGLPFGTAAVWLGAWVWLLGFTPMVTFGLLLFPDGHLPSPRWRQPASGLFDRLWRPCPPPWSPTGAHDLDLGEINTLVARRTWRPATGQAWDGCHGAAAGGEALRGGRGAGAPTSWSASCSGAVAIDLSPALADMARMLMGGGMFQTQLPGHLAPGRGRSPPSGRPPGGRSIRWHGVSGGAGGIGIAGEEVDQLGR